MDLHKSANLFAMTRMQAVVSTRVVSGQAMVSAASSGLRHAHSPIKDFYQGGIA
jgi:hypothetical protein